MLCTLQRCPEDTSSGRGDSQEGSDESSCAPAAQAIKSKNDRREFFFLPRRSRANPLAFSDNTLYNKVYFIFEEYFAEVIDILFYNSDFVVASKPRGMLSEGEFPAAVADALRASGELHPDELYVVHRLDRTTAGLMVCARNKRTAAELSKIIADGGFRKTYIAFVTADPALPPQGELRDMLFFDRNHDKAFVVDARHPRKGAKEAILSYETAAAFDVDGVTVTKLLVCPQTGRSHQIRVQFGSRKSPLLGDGKYGSRVKYHHASLISCGLKWKNFEFSLDTDQIVPVTGD